MSKIISRIKGGLGNQLFCYSAARRLALVNNAEFVIDTVTGFKRDFEYSSKYMLNHFNISARQANSNERLEPFERYRRGLLKWTSNRKPFSERIYLEQKWSDFNEEFNNQFLKLKVAGIIYLDGYWQSETYFKDIEEIIREDLKIIPPTDQENHKIASIIRNCNAVAVHVRWFSSPGSTEEHNVSQDYYKRAIALMEKRLDAPQYFLFSDDPEAAMDKLIMPKNRVFCITNNRGDANSYADLWLMTQCRHFIMANSTFSWWGSWLAKYHNKIIITPKLEVQGLTAWGFDGLIPQGWEII